MRWITVGLGLLKLASTLMPAQAMPTLPSARWSARAAGINFALDSMGTATDTLDAGIWPISAPIPIPCVIPPPEYFQLTCFQLARFKTPTNNAKNCICSWSKVSTEAALGSFCLKN
jgi:hypothetical protein